MANTTTSELTSTRDNSGSTPGVTNATNTPDNIYTNGSTTPIYYTENTTYGVTTTSSVFNTTSMGPGPLISVYIFTGAVSLLLIIVTCIVLLVYCVRTWGKLGDGLRHEEKDKLTSRQENADFILSRHSVMVDKACHVVMDGETPLCRIATTSRPPREAGAGSEAAYQNTIQRTDPLYADPMTLDRPGTQNANSCDSSTGQGATLSKADIDALYAKPMKKKKHGQTKPPA
ncbi:uncharacterized protein LOC124122798 isoform X2 [Haliotis rufescens]|uniref:uncharacterized protein LOC124122798 isoform X2 n=1 Tax=Haliotis rufescens TaxID=6454 RepID=UPI00201F191C|nr:uncharacterized protein LOC124122798 isoform X2 [Haliotis rufescens]